MSEERKIDPKHREIRDRLRVIGPVLIVVGGLFAAVGVIDFFMAFGGAGQPRLFWCVFVGMPILFLGLAATMYGFMGAVARYQAGEIAPVAKDTLNYVAEGAEDGVRTVARAIGEGLGAAAQGTDAAPVRCHKCSALNDADAKFCDECGTALSKSLECPACGEMNDPDARFCDDCGRRLA